MSETELEGFGGALDLSDANTKGMEPIDSGTWAFELFDWKWEKTKGGEGSKLPKDTPRLNCQFKCIDDPFENRRVFDGFNIPGPEYDAEKRAQALGFLARFLIGMGLDESEVKSKKFKLNDALTQLQGEPVLITVGVKTYEQGAREGELYNVVKGYKPIAQRNDDSGGGKLL